MAWLVFLAGFCAGGLFIGALWYATWIEDQHHQDLIRRTLAHYDRPSQVRVVTTDPRPYDQDTHP